jgi:hypothetical protein
MTSRPHHIRRKLGRAPSAAPPISGLPISLQADGFARIVLGADVERQFVGLAAVGDHGLGGVEVALAEAVLLKQVAPAARADLENPWLTESAG